MKKKDEERDRRVVSMLNRENGDIGSQNDGLSDQNEDIFWPE